MQTSKCAIPEKIQTGNPWNSTSFLINPWKFHMLFLWYPWKFHFLNPPCLGFFWNSPFVTLPLEILEKTKLHLQVFHKVVWNTLEIPRWNTKTDGNSTWFFLDHCWKFHFFFNWPVEFQYALFLIHLEILYHQNPHQGFPSPPYQPKICLSPPPGKIPPSRLPPIDLYLLPPKVNSPTK